MKSYERTRRSFLKAVGASALAIPFVQALGHSVARAAGGSGPLRFVGFYHPHGATSPFFGMANGESETNFDLQFADSVLSPFDDAATYGRSFKDRLLILEGVDLASAIRAGAGGHSAPSSILTGRGGAPGAPSLDQYLAVDRGLGASTPVTSLVLGVGSGSTSNEDCISFAGNGAPLPKMIKPRDTFDLAFSQVVAGQDPDRARELESLQRSKRSVLDFIKGDLGRLQRRLATAEKQKLDQHLTSIRELEKSVDALTGGGTTQPGTCTPPARPAELNAYQSYNNGEPNFEQITNLQIDLLATAFACDITRFVTLWTADLSRGATAGTGLSNLPDDCHNDLAHTFAAPRGNHYGSGADPGNPDTWRRLGVQNRYSYSKVARLLQRFQELDILDEVIVFVSSDMGDPAAHSSRNVPMLLAGGGGIAKGWRMGRRLKMADDCPPDRWYCDPPALVPHNRILVSIARAFGLDDVSSFGNPDIEQGPLDALL